MRLYGYNNITPELPKTHITAAPLHASRSHHRMRRVLSEGHGYIEVQTYGWFADDWLATLGFDPGPTLNVRNPIANNRRRMRTTLMPNLLAVANQNRKTHERFRIYELGRIFLMDGDQKREDDELAGVSVDTAPAEQHFRAVRGAIDDLVSAGGLPPLKVELAANASRPWMAAGSTLALSLRGEVVGHMGMLPAALKKEAVDSGNVVWFSLRVPALVSDAYPAFESKTPPVYPHSWQDFTLVWPIARGYRELAALLDTFKHPSIESREHIAFYRPKNSETGNYSFRYFLRYPDRTLSAEDIEDFRKAFTAFLAQHQISLV
jgi:phenylalanyl-tRNA synthetase beta chain